MKGKYIVIGSIILICGLIAYKLTVNKKELDTKRNQTTVSDVSIPVKVATVKDSLLELNINKTGTIIPFKGQSFSSGKRNFKKHQILARKQRSKRTSSGSC